MMDPGLSASLTAPRYEIVPMRGVERALEHLPSGATVTVTASPTRGTQGTLELVAALCAEGRVGRVVPHLAARLVSGPAQLDAVLTRLDELGVREAFVIAGDATTPAGPYEGAADLLVAMDRAGHGLSSIGITGYPESHPFLPDATTISAMADKAPYASYVVSQICFDPAVVRGWIATLRARGIDLPVHIGLPGVVDRAKLLRISLQVGLGDSLRFVAKQRQLAAHLVGGYAPDELIHGLADLVAEPGAGVAGWHLFTFNEIERTEAWRRELLRPMAGATT